MLPLKRNTPDDFQTPPIALNPLFPYLKKHWTIWECASGKGNLSKALKAKGYKVISTDIKKGKDFLTYAPKQFDCIVTNPPFSLKQEFLERAYQLNKPFCFLLPLTTLETKKRQQLFKENGTEIILLDKRVNFETPTGKDNSSWFATAWFCSGLGLKNTLNFASLNGVVKEQDFAYLTSNDHWFKLHPQKIAGVEYKTTSLHFPIQVKGTKADVLRVTGMSKQPNDLALKSKSRRRRIRLLQL